MISVPAPAKLNLFLHVTGRRPDGYHLLQSLFCLIDWQDSVALSPRADGEIVRQGRHAWPAAEDLTIRAAQALKAWAHAQGVPNAPSLGCSIEVDKHVPAGAGLGGGSSDAASCLLGLRSLWRLGVSDKDLSAIGLQLGADVPFFLFGEAAVAEGIGQHLRPLPSQAAWFVVAVPPVHVPTASIFRDPSLDRNAKAYSAAELQAASHQPLWLLGSNSLEPVACRQFPEVRMLLTQMQQTAAAMGLPTTSVRMSGSGGAVFGGCEDADQARQWSEALSQKAPTGTRIRVCQQLAQHPARALLQ